MVQMRSLVAFCSTLVGLSSAAALGSKEEYADGSVHAHIMGLKMVSSRIILCNIADLKVRLIGTLNLLLVRWKARSTQNWATLLARMVLLQQSLVTGTTPSSAAM